MRRKQVAQRRCRTRFTRIPRQAARRDEALDDRPTDAAHGREPGSCRAVAASNRRTFGWTIARRELCAAPALAQPSHKCMRESRLADAGRAEQLDDHGSLLNALKQAPQLAFGGADD